MSTHPRRRLALALTLGALLTLGATTPAERRQGAELPAQRRRPLVHPRQRLPRRARPRRGPTAASGPSPATWPPTSTPTTSPCRLPASARPPSPSSFVEGERGANTWLSSAGEVCGLLRASARQRRDPHLHRVDDHRGVRPPQARQARPASSRSDWPRTEGPTSSPRPRDPRGTEGTGPSGLVPSAARARSSARYEGGLAACSTRNSTLPRSAPISPERAPTAGVSRTRASGLIPRGIRTPTMGVGCGVRAVADLRGEATRGASLALVGWNLVGRVDHAPDPIAGWLEAQSEPEGS